MTTMMAVRAMMTVRTLREVVAMRTRTPEGEWMRSSAAVVVSVVARAMRILLRRVIDVTHRIWGVFLFVFLGLGLRCSLFGLAIFAGALASVVHGPTATAAHAASANPARTSASAGGGEVSPLETRVLGLAVVNPGTRSSLHGLQEVEKGVAAVLRRSITLIRVRVGIGHSVD
jgi:hypothetical protein